MYSARANISKSPNALRTDALRLFARQVLLVAGALSALLGAVAQGRCVNQEEKTVTLTVVFDNNRTVPKTESGWGFACWVDLPERHLLFDTGSNGQVLLRNLETLGLDTDSLDAVVISHMHWDHTGGLKQILQRKPGLDVYLPASATRGEIAELEQLGGAVHVVKDAQQLLPGAWSTGTLTEGIPEQSLVLPAKAGLLVLTGCAHPGIVSILRTVEQQFPGQKLELVLGGFHLWNQSKSAISRIVSQFKELGVVHPAPCHCSGDLARSLFRASFGTDAYTPGVGFRVAYESP